LALLLPLLLCLVVPRVLSLLHSLLLGFVLPGACGWVWVGEGTEPLCDLGYFKEDALTPRVVFAGAGWALLLCLVVPRSFAWVWVASGTKPLADLGAI